MTSDLLLPRATAAPLGLPRRVRVALALALGAVSTVVALGAAWVLSWPGTYEDVLVVPLVLGLVGCSVSVRLAVAQARRA